MADYTIKRLEEVHDVLGDYPGEMRMMTRDLEAEQVAFTYRRMPQLLAGVARRVSALGKTSAAAAVAGTPRSAGR